MARSDIPECSPIPHPLQETSVTKTGWYLPSCRWIFKLPLLPITASVACHAAVVVALLASDTPIPNDTVEFFSIELVSSDMVRSTRFKPSQSVNESGDDAVAVTNVRLNRPETWASPVPPMEDHQKLARLLALTDLSPEPIAIPFAGLEPLTTEHDRHRSGKTPILLPKIRKQEPIAKPKAAEISRKHDTTIDASSSFELVKSYDDTVKKDLPVEAKSVENANSVNLTATIAPAVSKDPNVGGDMANQIALNEGTDHASPVAGNPKPHYPKRAVRKGWQGRVILDVEILSSGSVGVLKTATSSGYWVLDQAAIKAVNKWRFTPARLAGMPVRSHIQIPVHFKLQ